LQHPYPVPRNALQGFLNSTVLTNSHGKASSSSLWQAPSPPAKEILQPQPATSPPAAPPSSLQGATKPMMGLRWLLAVLELKKMTAWDTVSTRPWRVTCPLMILCKSSQPNSQAHVPTMFCPLRHICKWPAQLATSRHPRGVILLKEQRSMTSGLSAVCL
jgi:hypothetical protein